MIGGPLEDVSGPALNNFVKPLGLREGHAGHLRSWLHVTSGPFVILPDGRILSMHMLRGT